MCDRIDEASRLNIVLEYMQEYYRKIKDKEERASSKLEILSFKDNFNELIDIYNHLIQERIFLGRLLDRLEKEIEKKAEEADG